jgi:hypothetical protein
MLALAEEHELAIWQLSNLEWPIEWQQPNKLAGRLGPETGVPQLVSFRRFPCRLNTKTSINNQEFSN